MASDAETFYEHQRAIGVNFGIVLPSWDALSFHEQQEWEDRLNEQINRDKEYNDSRHD